MNSETSFTDWRAGWIHHIGSRNPRNHYAWFRKMVKLPAPATSARVHVTADSRYALYVNGHFIGRGPARCDPRFQSYDTYDVTPQLRKGPNVFGALVHHYGVGTGAYILGAEGLLLQAKIRLATGGQVAVHTDESWVSRDAGNCWTSDVHRINDHQEFREVYDARNEPVGWMRPDYDDMRNAAWMPVRLLGRPPVYPWLTLHAREIPGERTVPVRPKRLMAMGVLDISPQRFAALSRQDLLEELTWGSAHVPVRRQADLPQGRPAYFLYDMGREISAYYRLSVDAPSGITIDMGSSERLVNGRIPPLRPPPAKPAAPRTVDRYVTRSGRQTWSNAFHWRGFRYLQVVVNPWSSKIRHLDVGGVCTTADIPCNGHFACSDQVLNRLWQAGKHTMECCLHDGMVDNPWREQQQYLGDGRLDNLFIYYTFGDARLPRNLLRQIAQSQGPLGEIQSGSPWSFDQVVTEGCALWITALKEYCLFTGDRRLARELTPVLQNILRWHHRYLNRQGLLDNVPGWTFIDWVRPPMDGQGPNLRGRISAGLNLFYLQGLLDAAWLARHAGIDLNPAPYERQAARLRRAIHQAFWNPNQGCYVDAAGPGAQSHSVSLHVNALALLLDVAPPASWYPLISRLWSAKTPIHQPSPYFCFYVFRALAKCGRYDLALTALREKWRPMLDAGHQTFWETFVTDKDPGHFPESYCQMWSCTPLYDLPAEVLGVKPLKPGFRTFEVCPTPVDLQWAKGRVPTPQGPIQVAWERKSTLLHLDLCVPDRCAAIVRAPDGWMLPAAARVYRAGRHRMVFRIKPRINSGNRTMATERLERTRR